VKKYHQSPVFGVRSGRVNLRKNMSAKMKLGNTLETYVAPHVCGIHAKFPAIRHEIIVNAVIYRKNSADKGKSFRKSASMGFGEARWEWGSVMRSSKIGRRITMDDNDRWTSMDNASKDCDAFSTVRMIFQLLIQEAMMTTYFDMQIKCKA
jgi:hypothetical protein